MPDFGRSSLNRYNDPFFTRQFGRISFSAVYHGNYHSIAKLQKLIETYGEELVANSADVLLGRIKANAPYKTGALRSGLIRRPENERTAVFSKIVKDILFDAGMNDTFVKFSKSGIRYYYPSSQEYGFRLRDGRDKDGLYYVRNTALDYYGTHISNIVDGIEKILEVS